MGPSTHSFTPIENMAIIAAEQRGQAFLVYRDGRGDLRLTELGERERISIGRIAGNDIVLDWDPQVSRTHAQFERIGVNWMLADDGLSRNGSHVNEERIAGRRPLNDGDVVRVGRSTLVFRSPRGGRYESTMADAPSAPALTDAERRVLVALCAPLATEGGDASVPSTNTQIAAALNISVPGVKTHVRALFTKLGVGDLPQYQKRTELARRALQQGLVTRGDLRQ